KALRRGCRSRRLPRRSARRRGGLLHRGSGVRALAAAGRRDADHRAGLPRPPSRPAAARSRPGAARARSQGRAARHPGARTHRRPLTAAARGCDEARVRRHALTLLAASVLLLVARDSRARPPACAPRRLLVAGAPLLLPARANAQALLLTSTQASIVGPCAPTALRMKPTKRATVVKA